MNDLRLFLRFCLKYRIRTLCALIKNLYKGLLIVFFLIGFFAIQSWKLMTLNRETLYLYRKEAFLLLCFLNFVFFVWNKKTPFLCHPASLHFFSGSKFKKILVFKLIQKLLKYTCTGFLLAFIFSKFQVTVQILTLQPVIWNLLTFSFAARFLIYHKAVSTRRVYSLFLIHALFLNLSLYAPSLLKWFILFATTSYSLFLIVQCTRIPIFTDDLLSELIHINRANDLTKGRNLSDAKEFCREISAKRHRKNFLLRLFRFNDPLLQKHLISFSRTNLFIAFYLFSVLILLLILYRFELFEFVIKIKNNGLGTQVLGIHQALMISNLFELIASQQDILIAKSQDGLYLPYSRKRISFSFFKIGVPVLTIELLIVGAVLRISILTILISFLLYVLLLLLILNLKSEKKGPLFRFAILSVLFGISIFFFIA